MREALPDSQDDFDPVSTADLTERLRRHNESNAPALRAITKRLTSSKGRRQRELAAAFWRRIRPEGGENAGHALRGDFEIDLDGARAIVAMLLLHPAATVEQPLPIGLDLFSTHPREGPIAALQYEAALVLGSGALAIGARRENGKLLGDGRLVTTLLHVAFGVDDLDITLRGAVIGNPDPLRDPTRDPLDRLPDLPQHLREIGRELERRSCLLGLGHAARGFAGTAEAILRARKVHYRAWADNIVRLLPNERYAGTEVSIQGAGFGANQPADVSVLFPHAGGGCLVADVKPGRWSDAEVVVVVPEEVGDGAVGFLRRSAPAGETVVPNPMAAAEFANTLVACLGPTVSGVADVFSHWMPVLPAAPCPGLRPDDANHFFGGPVLVNLSTPSAKAGDVVVANGLNLDVTDVVTIGGIAAATLATSGTTLDFVVPVTKGGPRTVTIRHGLHESNARDLRVRPVITGVSPAGRLLPNSTVTLLGSGFTASSRVRVNQETTQAFYATNAELEFRIFRPAGVTSDKRGEPVEVQVINLDGEVSNIVQLTLQTYRMVAFGDSIAWGQGLLTGDKYSALVARHLQRNLGDIGVYNEDVAAHSGAKIGLKPVDAPGLPTLPGEVPTDYPTIAEQVNTFSIREPSAGLGWIDLVLLNGGINDVQVDIILDPLTSTAQIKALATIHCHDAMRTLLDTTLMALPNAKVIVTGYYPLISYDSDTSLILYSLLGLGVVLAGIPGAIVGGALSIWVRNAIATNAETFSREANAQLQFAVDETRAATPQRSIALAVPAFGSRNAALAPESWVWEIDATMTPRDPVAASRAPECAAGAAIQAYGVDPARCRVASIGHPNSRGAQAYLDAIVPFL